ncbi:transcriptional repressor [Brevundimonas sp. FT23042]|uniref:transcriptional repressor n=1 Tax=Brevundimonas sp. FT23042 TaxID=3393749 RepID=UPI003B587A68
MDASRGNVTDCAGSIRERAGRMEALDSRGEMSSGTCDHSLDSIAASIRRAGGLFGAERKAIASTLLAASEPLDADAIWLDVCRGARRLSRSTVHRVLNAFHDVGVVEMTLRPRGRRLYRLRRGRPSVFLVCAETGQALEIEDPQLAVALQRAVQDQGCVLSGAIELRVEVLSGPQRHRFGRSHQDRS